MPIKYNLTPRLRVKLKQPLGTLVRGSFTETTNRFSEMASKEQPPSIIAVGDTVSENLAKNHILVKLSIIDNKCMRKNVQPKSLGTERTFHVKNPQGTITEEAIAAIQEALQSSQRSKIVVEGEEDLLTLIAIMNAPEDSFVLYGQPHEGIVVVKATQDKKTKISELLKAMEKGSKN
jgi:GTP-dependent dephospho-CoA kinase